jgi:hypothetical protein
MTDEESDHDHLKRQISRLSADVLSLKHEVSQLMEIKSALLQGKDLRDFVEASGLGYVSIKKEGWQWLTRLICAIEVKTGE